MPQDRHRDTDVLHRGERESGSARPLNRPIYETTTFVFESAAELETWAAGRSDRYLYTRYANPTIESAEEKLALLEGAEAALVTASGMAATATALFGLLAPGDQLVCSTALYGGTLKLISGFLERFGIVVHSVDMDALRHPEAHLGPTAKVLWFETPSNPTLRCIDIRRVTEACRARGVLSVLDSTFATPINQQPLAMGVDLVMHSATKYLNGHSDVTAGGLAGSRAIIDRLRSTRSLFGGTMDPAAAYALARGMKTLPVRMARHNENAQQLAEWLDGDRRVARVFHPGLPSHPDHAIARAQMSGFGGMITFEPVGGYVAACRVFDRLSLVLRAVSLGGVESLCTMPVLSSHHGVPEDELQQAGITPGMLRLSVGLEHIGDLIADLDQALG